MQEALRILDTLIAEHPIYCATGFIVCRSISVIIPPVPGFPMDLLAVRVFGPMTGFLLAEAGIMLGASVAFAASRTARNVMVLSPAARHLTVLTRCLRRGSDAAQDEHQIIFWLVVRLLTNPLFDSISYAAGLTR